MSDAAAFRATYAGCRSLTGGGFRFSFDVDGPNTKAALDALTQGGMPSAAKGDWFAIARLNLGKEPGEDRDDSLKSGRHALYTTEGSTAPASGKGPARSPSQWAFLLCNEPSGRVFLEQRRRHAIPAANHINNVDEAKHVLRAWLDIESLSELDRDTAAADRFEHIQDDYKTWLTAARYVETT